MCTVTLIARRHGYALGMNRDEQLTRPVACPPSQHQCGSRTAILPSEPGGGTWIGVNDAGVTFALINWYSVTRRVAGKALSRGEIPLAVLATDSPTQADAVLESLTLGRVNPFRLVGVFPTQRAVVEWRWNLHELTQHEHPWRSATWISSGHDEAGAQVTRAKVFRTALRQRRVGTADWLQRLHRSHRPEIGPYCHCMHRADAATVSYTEVRVGRADLALCYTPGAPCSHSPLPARQMRRQDAVSAKGLCRLRFSPIVSSPRLRTRPV